MKQINKIGVCEEAVFSQFFQSNVKILRNYLLYKFGNEEQANDVSQEAFIKLWENCQEVPLEKAKGFIYKVASNVSLNKIAHQKVVLAFTKKTNLTQHTNESPEFILEKEQFLERYQKALGKLSEEQRVAFLLNKADGKKHSEIAEILGITQKVVEYRIYTAFSFLKNELEGFKIK